MTKTFCGHDTADLLKANPKALQFMHDSAGMDFEKPYIIIKESGKFTLNTVKKALRDAAPDYTEIEYIAGVMMMRKNGTNSDFKLHYVAIRSCSFDIQRNRRVSYWKYNIDRFFSVGDFETSRKLNTSDYYIIAQQKSLLSPLHDEQYPDLSQRFKFNKNERVIEGTDRRGMTYISQIPLVLCDGSGRNFTYKPFDGCYPQCDSTDDITRMIDSSGYITIARRRELKRRAEALRAQRNKAAAAATRYTERETAISSGIEVVKKAIASAITSVSDGGAMYKYSEKIRNLSGVMNDYSRHIKRTESNAYSSVSDIEYCLSKLEQRLSIMKDVSGNWDFTRV